MNEYTALWLVLAVAFGIAEASTTNLTTIWFAVASVLMAVLSVLRIGFAFQLIIFAVISAALVILTRPFAKRILSKKAVPTNADRIISMKGIVTEEINSVTNTGQIKVLGQVWSAKTLTDEKILEGTEVVVKSLEGVRAVVEVVGELQKI